MIVDRKYCMSSFLMYRRIADKRRTFREGVVPRFPDFSFGREKISNSLELLDSLKRQVAEATSDGKAALALSGGIDSAILAKLMPKGSTAYTFKCVVPGVQVVDETAAAAEYAKECGLKHKIVEVYWEDCEKYASELMKHKGAPIHSIEIQIFKASLQAKQDGFERLIYGESADCVFGGLSNLLSKDWSIGDFIDRYSYVMPYKVLRDPELVLEPIVRHERNGMIDPHEFLATEFYPESVASYINAAETADFEAVLPYSRCVMSCPIDYNRIRHGENKYIVREVFNSLYSGFDIPEKLPMPRPTNEWFKYWPGPTHDAFYPHCVSGMSGDQKWLIWSLERFLHMIDESEKV